MERQVLGPQLGPPNPAWEPRGLIPAGSTCDETARERFPQHCVIANISSLDVSSSVCVTTGKCTSRLGAPMETALGRRGWRSPPLWPGRSREGPFAHTGHTEASLGLRRPACISRGLSRELSMLSHLNTAMQEGDLCGAGPGAGTN